MDYYSEILTQESWETVADIPYWSNCNSNAITRQNTNFQLHEALLFKFLLNFAS